ncbi:twin-arginine translocase TatA/TatE family subunit [Streptomyces sp. NPDC002573]|uniref:twin-arginine translocase TatA/TatE family subunit n=1 Tax=Streptomyces sp. NPDC002573 TaxID=3364651 RepID=UPI003699D401
MVRCLARPVPLSVEEAVRRRIGVGQMLRNGLQPWHLLIVAIVIIWLVSPKKLPDTVRALGKARRILKSGTKAMKADSAVRSTGAPTEGGTPIQTEPTVRALRSLPVTPLRSAGRRRSHSALSLSWSARQALATPPLRPFNPSELLRSGGVGIEYRKRGRPGRPLL